MFFFYFFTYSASTPISSFDFRFKNSKLNTVRTRSKERKKTFFTFLWFGFPLNGVAWIRFDSGLVVCRGSVYGFDTVWTLEARVCTNSVLLFVWRELSELCCAISGCPSRYDFLVPCVFVRASGFFLFRFFCVQVFIGKD